MLVSLSSILRPISETLRYIYNSIIYYIKLIKNNRTFETEQITIMSTTTVPNEEIMSTTAAAANFLNTSKSPLQLLNELCRRQGVNPPVFGVPRYIAPPDSIFAKFWIQCKVIFNHNKVFESTGEGSKIQKAKQKAAANILMAIKNRSCQQSESTSEEQKAVDDLVIKDEDETITDGNCSTSESQSSDSSDISTQSIPTITVDDLDADAALAMELSDDVTAEAVLMLGNPISSLKEYCEKNRIDAPVYNIIKSDGPAHRPVFTVECAVEGLKFNGCGTNKQMSKKFAAYKAYKAITTAKEESEV